MLTTARAARPSYIKEPLAIALVSSMPLLTSRCAVTRCQETVSAYIDDTAVTTAVTIHFFCNRLVEGTAMSVETLNGAVMPSGFAKYSTEKPTSESIARKTNGVKAVKSEIAVRP